MHTPNGNKSNSIDTNKWIGNFVSRILITMGNPLFYNNQSSIRINDSIECTRRKENSTTEPSKMLYTVVGKCVCKAFSGYGIGLEPLKKS